MKQVLLMRPGLMEVVTASATLALQPKTARIRIQAVGICGSDKHIFLHGGIGETRIAQPFVLGHEAMGTVEDIGPDADPSLIGKRVAIEPAIHCGHCAICLRGDVNLCPDVKFLGHPPTPGAFQEYLTHPCDLLTPIPDSISDDGAVLMEPLGVVIHALDLAKIRFGSKIAVLGSGPIGLLCVWMAKMLQPELLMATDLYDFRLKAASDLGATHTLNASQQNVIAWSKEITQGKGFDYVIEAAGSDETNEQTAEIAGPGAKVVVIGIAASDRVSFRHAAARRKGLTIIMVRRSRQTLHRAVHLMPALTPFEKILATHHAGLEGCGELMRMASTYEDGVVKAVVQVS